jgi:hypothetical protein
LEAGAVEVRDWISKRKVGEERKRIGDMPGGETMGSLLARVSSRHGPRG